MLKVTFGVEISGHYSEEKGKENTSYYILFMAVLMAIEAPELALLGSLSL